jgi:hypothetical protein
MAVITKAQLKKSFENGDRPDETDFVNLIDSAFNGAFSTLGSISAEKLRVDSNGLSALDDFTFTNNVTLNTFTCTGTATLSGATVFAGTVETKNITFGTDDTHSVTFNSDIASNLVADAVTYNIGLSAKRWGSIFATGPVHEPITSSTIKMGVDSDLHMDAHHISFEELEIISNVTLNIYDEAVLNIINV